MGTRPQARDEAVSLPGQNSRHSQAVWEHRPPRPSQLGQTQGREEELREMSRDIAKALPESAVPTQTLCFQDTWAFRTLCYFFTKKQRSLPPLALSGPSPLIFQAISRLFPGILPQCYGGHTVRQVQRSLRNSLKADAPRTPTASRTLAPTDHCVCPVIPTPTPRGSFLDFRYHGAHRAHALENAVRTLPQTAPRCDHPTRRTIPHCRSP